MRIEDYAVIGDTETVALVGRDGSIDWLCVPRFDSGACFASLLGKPENGRWLLAPRAPLRTRRRYRPDSLVLETQFDTEDGSVRVTDCMPIRGESPAVVRVVDGLRGRVQMRTELVVAYDFGHVTPWWRSAEGRLHAVAGADGLVLESAIALTYDGRRAHAELDVNAGDRATFVLTWYPSFGSPPPSPDARRAVDETDAFWRSWAARCTVGGPYRDAVVRSLITLKALTHAPTGAVVAAGTASLPEDLGGSRNWDYRYSWLRDATFTLECLLEAGYEDEARAWRDWLLRVVAGDATKLQIMYGLAGERRLDERTIKWLDGYEGSRPVRIGNAAAGQLQLDVYGEVIEALFQARRRGLAPDPDICAFEKGVLQFLADNWKRKDEGLWEIRSDRQRFTHSKVMAWVAFDRAVKSVERFGLDGPVDEWKRLRDAIHADVCQRAYDEELGSFTQAYGSRTLDASLLLLPVVGFLPPDDPRILGTIRAIERELTEDGFVHRYPTHEHGNLDGVPGREGTFLACSFWLVDALTLVGRKDDARRLFERILSVRSDVGLLSEEYDVGAGRLVGNFPQAFSHVGLVNSAQNLLASEGPAAKRRRS